MESLRSLLIKNQSYLGKLKARSLYCIKAINTVKSDTHKLYGSFSSYWDEWMMQAEEMDEELNESINNTTLFLLELRDFISNMEAKKRLTKANKSYILEVKSLTEGKLLEQIDLLRAIDEEIHIHKQLTEKLLTVEAIDSLSDE